MSTESNRTMRLIVNGKSAGNDAVRSAVTEIRSRGISLDVRATWEGGDAARYAAEAARDRIDVVIAGGGDGTVNEVVDGLLRCDDESPALAVLPLGTANDFANGCGIPVADPLAALTLAASGRIVAIDVGKANDQHFLNVASGGFGAEVTANTPPELKRALGGAAYSLMGILTVARMAPYQFTLTLADGTKHEGSMLAMIVGNGCQCGGGKQVAPRAMLDDGRLDLVVLHDIDFQSFGQAIEEMLSLGDEGNQIVSYAQVEGFHISSDQPIQVNLDGEPVRSREFDFRVVPKAIRLVLPNDSPLVSAD